MREGDRYRTILSDELRKTTQVYVELSERGLKHIRSTHALSQCRLYLATIHMLKNGKPLMVTIDIPDEFPLLGRLHLTNCTIQCFLPKHQERVAFLFFELKQEKVHIVDLHVERFCRRQGMGSLMVGLLEDISSGFAMKEISGWLSSVDFHIRDIQIAFYQSNGYSVKCHDEQCTEGYVRKDISDLLAQR